MVAGIPFKTERVEEIQWEQLLSKHFLSGVFISSNFWHIFSYEKEEKQEKWFL